MSQNLCSLFAIVFTLFSCSPTYAQVNTVVQTGHVNAVSELAISPDGKILASTDGLDIILWDLSTGMQFKTLYIGEGKQFLLTNLSFVDAEGCYMICYLYNQTYIYQNILTDEIIAGAKIQNHLNDTIDDYAELNKKYPNRFADNSQYEQYLNELAELNENSLETWEELEKAPKYFGIDHTDDGKIRVTRTYSEFTGGEAKAMRKYSKKCLKSNKKANRKNKGNLKKGRPLLPIRTIPHYPNRGDANVKIEIADAPGSYVKKKITIDQTMTNINGLPVREFKISPDGLTLIDKIYLYNLHQKDKKHEKLILGKFKHGKQETWSDIQYSKDGNYAITSSMSEDDPFQIIVWDIDSLDTKRIHYKKRELIFDTIAHLAVKRAFKCAPVKRIITTNNNLIFVALHSDSSLTVWDISEQQDFKQLNLSLLRTLKDNDIFNIQSIQFVKETNSIMLATNGRKQQASRILSLSLENGSINMNFGPVVPPAKFRVSDFRNNTLYGETYVSDKSVLENANGFLKMNPWRVSGLKNLNLLNGMQDARSVESSIVHSYNWSKALTGDVRNPKKLHDISSHLEVVLDRSDSFAQFKGNDELTKIAAANDSILVIWNQEGRMIYTDSNDYKIESFNVNSKGNIVTYTGVNGELHQYDLEKGVANVLPKPRQAERIEDMKAANSIRKELGLGVFSVASVIQSKKEGVKAVIAQTAVTMNKNKKGLPKRLVKPELKPSVNKFYDEIEISADGKKMIAWRGFGSEMYYYNFGDPKFLPDKPEFFFDHRYLLKHLVLDESIRLAQASGASERNEESIEALYLLKESEKLKNHSDINEGFTHFARIANPHSVKRKLIVTKLDESKDVEITDRQVPIDKPVLSATGKYVAASSASTKIQIIRVWDANTGVLLKTLVGHRGDLVFSKDERYLISSGEDCLVKVWDIESGDVVQYEPVAIYLPFDGSEDYMLLTSDNYYLSSKGNSRAIAFQYGIRAYPFEQFDLKYNRPDLVISKLPASKEAEMTGIKDSYFNAYLHRLNKMGLMKESVENTESDLPPVVSISNKYSLTPPDGNGRISLSIKGHSVAPNAKTNRLQVFVNGVSVYGETGLEVSHSTKLDTLITIQLSHGRNKIQVRMSDTRGVYSLYDALITEFVPTTQKSGTIYAIALAASEIIEYDQYLPELEKDALDWIAHYNALKNEGLNVVTKIYKGKDVTRKVLDEIHALLLNSDVNDEVYLFYGGHGVGDVGKIRLSSSDVNFDRLMETSFSLDELNMVFDEIPARKRVLLVNSCHSGEFDNSPYFKTMQALFQNLDNSVGSNVVVSCEALQKADRGSTREQGHTYFGKLLMNTLAMTNENKILFSDFARLIEEGGRVGQNPNVRRSNFDNDFNIH